MKKLTCILILTLTLGLTIYWNIKPKEQIEFVSETTFHSKINNLTASASDIQNDCNVKTLKNEAKIELDEYTFESMAYKPYKDFIDKKLIVAEFSVFNNEEYRVINISEGFIKPLTINLYDKKHKLIDSNINNQKQIFDFKATNSGNYTIEFVPSNEDTKNINKKCIAFSIGYK